MTTTVLYNFLPSGGVEEITDNKQKPKQTSEPIIAPPPASTTAEIREELFGIKNYQ